MTGKATKRSTQERTLNPEINGKVDIKQPQISVEFI
jgi:hypothetical protein